MGLESGVRRRRDILSRRIWSAKLRRVLSGETHDSTARRLLGPLGWSARHDEHGVLRRSHEVRELKITVLSTMLADQGIGEWGFAAVVEVDGKRLLFDTGARPETVLSNARELKIDLASIEDVVLSHNHADHTGGLVRCDAS